MYLAYNDFVLLHQLQIAAFGARIAMSTFIAEESIVFDTLFPINILFRQAESILFLEKKYLISYALEF